MKMSVQQTAIGQVQVWTGEVGTSFSLNVVEDKHGLRLMDNDGKTVTPNSPRLGFHGRRPGVSHEVVLDNLGDEWVEKLTAAGYRNVKPHG
jgi:hypothetical protein